MNEPLFRLLDTTREQIAETKPWFTQPPSEKWKTRTAGIWKHLAFGELPPFGWKIHVSSRLEDAPDVLRVVSKRAFEANCTFKHLLGQDAFLILHFKNASRLQSGKFITLYPRSVDVADSLMSSLSTELGNFQGPDILTDRAYRGARNVFYRWGAFRDTGRLDAKGTPEELVPNGLGEMVPDTRDARFTLPDGLIDPFWQDALAMSDYRAPQSIHLDQFEINEAIRFTNGGGRYKGKCQVSGVDVVVKEGRPHTGYVGSESAIPRLRREVETMKSIEAVHPELTPRIVKTFTLAGHEYAALEYLAGTPLSEWIARQNPLYSCEYRLASEVHKYLARATRILSQIRLALGKLHDVGLAFGDMSVGNIIIDEQDNARLIDFEACTSVDDRTSGLRTQDFSLIDADVGMRAADRDWFAYHCIAISFVIRLTTLAEISGHVLKSVNSDLERLGIVAPPWWAKACRHVRTASRRYSSYNVDGFVPPTVATGKHRSAFRDLIIGAALDSYDAEAPYLFPTSATARQGAFLSFGVGASGLLYAARLNGYDVPRDVVSRYAESLARALECRTQPLNYHIGLSGFIEPCNLLGLTGLSARIVKVVEAEWDQLEDPSLGAGLAGVAVALQRSGRFVSAERAMSKALLRAVNFDWKKNGLLYGRSGLIGAACQFSSLLAREQSLANIVVRLISEEMAQTVRHPRANSLSLRGEVGRTRLLPYISDGTAGLLIALLLAHESQDVAYTLEAADLIALTADLGTPFMLECSLLDGAAGLAVVLDMARAKFPSLSEQLPESGWQRIEKYWLPYASGVGVLHPKTLRFDFSHSQGSAGVAEALLWRDSLCELNLSGLLIPRLGEPSADNI